MAGKKEGGERGSAEGEGQARKAAPFGWKKALYGASILISFGGSLVLLAFTFLLNDAMDKARDLVLANVQAVQGELESLEGTLAAAEAEVGTVDATLDGLEATLVPLESGLSKTGTSIGGFADTVAMMPLVGGSMPVGDLRNASASMAEAASRLNQTVATFGEHKANMDGLKAGIEDVRLSVAGQKAALAQTGKALGDIFGLMKVANFLFFLVVICMFSMLVINSAAGLL